MWSETATEKALVRRGFHASGEWWCDLFDRYEACGARVVCVRAGRRAGKTTHVCRKLVSDALEKDWKVDPGDVGILAVVSARKPQAEDRIATITKYLEALNVEILRKNNSRVDFVCKWGVCSARALAASGGDVVSGTWIGALLDEVARWIDDRGVNPASEVIASAKPSLLSTGGTMWMVSSPMSTDDAHAKTFARGDSPGQMVAHAPTWVACAELYSEADCRELEPDDILFKREYAAIPTASSGMYWLPTQLLEQAQFEPFGAPITRGAGGDLAFLRDAAAMASVGIDAKGTTGPLMLKQWTSDEAIVAPSHVLLEGALLLKMTGVDSVITDRHARAHMREAANATGLGYRFAPDNGAHLSLLRRLTLSRTLALPRCAGRCACTDGKTCDLLVRQLQRIKVNVEGDRVRVTHERAPTHHGDLAEAFALGAYACAQSPSGEAFGDGKNGLRRTLRTA
jgi:hypothetical protein